MRHLGDITKINGAEASPVNVIIGGRAIKSEKAEGKGPALADGYIKY